jgi:hypothetical protein
LRSLVKISSLLTGAFAVVSLFAVGCGDPCGDLVAACEECTDEVERSNCILGAELADALGADDACQDALDQGDVCTASAE